MARMPVLSALRAPTQDRAILAVPDFSEIPSSIAAQRRFFASDGFPGECQAIRQLARQELAHALNDPVIAGAQAVPLVITGHQPELSHPGVWAKHFAAAGIARSVSGVSLNLIVDHDLVKSTTLTVPRLTLAPGGELKQVDRYVIPFDDPRTTGPYENQYIQDPALFSQVPTQVHTATANWPERPIISEVWPASAGRESLATLFSRMRIEHERAWGCVNHELPVSQLSRWLSFHQFARWIGQQSARLREIHNRAVRDYRRRHRLRSRTHPVPELQDDELPFWTLMEREGDPHRLERVPLREGMRYTDLRPRALTLTLFVRMFLADHFIHGLGGGKYDEVTDQIMREFFGISPPQYQVVTGTLRLNLPRFPTMEEERRRAERYLRDLDWNPQSVSERDDPRWQQLRADKMDLIPLDPPTSAERKARFRRLNALTQQLRAYLEEERLRAGHRLQQIASELDANRLLAQRDYPWLLHSANRLQEFLRPLLD